MRLECDAVLFDLDGVLVDSQACVERYWRQWAAQHNLDAEALLQVAHGRRTIEVMRQFCTELPEDELAAEAEDLIRQASVDTEGVRKVSLAGALLRMLPKERWAVVTSGSALMATTRIRHTRLPVPLVLVAAEDVTHGKPHPEPYLTAAERLGYAPEHCLVVEDAPAGIEAAHHAGMQVVAVTTTHTAEALSDADAVIARLADFWPSLLGEHLLISIREL